MAEVSAIPRNPVWGLGADVLAKIREMAEAASKANPLGIVPVGEIIKMLVGNKPELLEDAAYGFPPTTGTGQATQIKPQYASDVSDVIPWGKAASAAKAMAAKIMAPEMAAGVAGLGGMLRPKGDPRLMYSHGLSGGLDDRSGGVIKELMHPSLAVTGGGSHYNTFGEHGLLIPKPGAFDPAYSPSSLFNRDAYIARTGEFPGGRRPTAQQRVENMGLLPPPHSEASRDWNYMGPGGFRKTDPDWFSRPNTPHTTAISSSPAFRSFAEFEKSPAGAATLGKKYNDIFDWNDRIKQDFENWFQRAEPGNDPFDTNWLQALRAHAGQGDKEAQSLLKRFKTAPSEYGELKVSGSVPVTGNRWAGALLNDYELERYGDLLAGRGIPSMSKEGLNPKSVHEMATAMQEMAGPVKERSLRVRAGWEPGQDVPAPEIMIEGKGAPGVSHPTSSGQGLASAQEWLANNPSPPSKKTAAFDSKEDAMKAAGANNPGIEWLHSPGVIKKDDFSKIAAAYWSPGGATNFKHAGSTYTIYPDGKLEMVGVKGTVAYLDVKPPPKQINYPADNLLKHYDMGMIEPKEMLQKLWDKAKVEKMSPEEEETFHFLSNNLGLGGDFKTKHKAFIITEEHPDVQYKVKEAYDNLVHTDLKDVTVKVGKDEFKVMYNGQVYLMDPSGPIAYGSAKHLKPEFGDVPQ